MSASEQVAVKKIRGRATGKRAPPRGFKGDIGRSQAGSNPNTELHNQPKEKPILAKSPGVH
jgi:hypothetical protein